jgi:hypothetical protein
MATPAQGGLHVGSFHGGLQSGFFWVADYFSETTLW